jgi:hypothetical protein
VQINNPVPKWATISFSVARPLKLPQTLEGLSIPHGSAPYIFAYGRQPPANRDDPKKVQLGIHDEAGEFDADFLLESQDAPVVLSVSQVPPTVVNTVHGVSMFIAWGVVPFAGYVLNKPSSSCRCV